MVWYKKDIGKFEKITAPIFLVFALAFVALGIYGIVDGVISLINGGYGDNIIIGVMVLVLFPLLMVATFLMITTTDKEWL